MKKTDFSNRFHLIDPSLLREYIDLGSSPFIPDGSNEFTGTQPVIFSQTPETDEHGTTWRQTFSASTADISLLKYNRSRAYIIFHMSDGTIRLIGNQYEAPYIEVTSHPGVLQISVEFSALEPVVL